MKKIIAIFTIFMMISASMISCEKEEKTTINFLNWGENIAEGLIDEFEEKYNIKVNEVFVMISTRKNILKVTLLV